MSPLATHIAKHVQNVVNGARPGLVRVYVVVAEYADGSEATHTVPPRHEDMLDAAHGDLIPTQVTNGTGLPERREGEGAVSYVQRVRRERGQVEAKPRDWAPKVDLSINEIERAMTGGVLAYRLKPHGRDHGAKVITAQAMLEYLTAVDAVERELIPQPSWWPAVRTSGKKAA